MPEAAGTGALPKWLVKSEPSSFSWADLLASKNHTTAWDGVRNYQARNFLRDGFRLRDRVLFYQSCAKPLAVVGLMEVSREAYPDPSQFDPDSDYFDGTSTPAAPRWWAVDLRAIATFAQPITLDSLREAAPCQPMELLRKGSRLSVQPVPAGAARFFVKQAMRRADGRIDTTGSC